MSGAVSCEPSARNRLRRDVLSPVAGGLGDGTPYFVPVCEVRADEDGVCCHLCGCWFRSVSAHLRTHGWTRQLYLDAFGLEQSASLECASTRARRAARFVARAGSAQAVRDGVEFGHALARSGDLAEHAAKAAQGRRHSAQRRRKTLAALATVSPERRNEVNRLRRQRELQERAHLTAVRFGFPDLDSYVDDRMLRGMSLAAICREAGLHVNWLQRHLAKVAPDTAARLASLRRDGADQRWLSLTRSLGFPDVASYLRDRHVERRWTVNAIAMETRFSRDAVRGALARHGIEVHRHRTRRSVGAGA